MCVRIVRAYVCAVSPLTETSGLRRRDQFLNEAAPFAKPESRTARVSFRIILALFRSRARAALFLDRRLNRRRELWDEMYVSRVSIVSTVNTVISRIAKTNSGKISVGAVLSFSL